MTTEKARVKDISAELGVSNKDLLQALRELDIQAKSHMSTLTPEEVAEVKDRFKDSTTTATKVERKEVQPGVIVRRRRKSVAPAAQEQAPADQAPAAEHEGEEEVEVEEASATAQHEVQETEAASDHAETEEAAEEERAPDPGATAARTQTAARIIATPGQEPEPVAEPAAQDRADMQAEDQTEVQAEPEAEAPEAAQAEEAATQEPGEQVEDSEQAPSQDEDAPETAEIGEQPEDGAAGAQDAEAGDEAGDEAQEGEEDEDAKKAKKKRKKKPQPTTEPQVRVISRPDPAEQPKPARPTRPAERPAPASARPAGPRPSGPGRPAPGAPAPVPDDDSRGKKKRKKDKRVVEFPQQAGMEEEDRRKASLQAKKKKGQPIKDKTGGKPRGGGRRRRGFQDFEPHAEETQAISQPVKASKRKIKIDEAIRLQDLAHQMGIKAQALIKVLFGLGVMATINQSLDEDTASLVAAEFGYEIERVGFSEDTFLMPQTEDKPEDLKGRPPVVTIMGHVDHGKTSLLDAIRESHVTSGEAGGITQHIGAYHVPTPRGEVVFLDTPGHEAFTAMRARGAQVTDIVVLVVAADDGVMDQTREAVNHSKAAGVPIMVAVNKIDKEGADPDRARRELSELGLLPEDWGGETIFANVSAKQHIGIDELLELILLQAEVLELKANPDKPARGRIVEARLDKGRGAVATVLIQEGSLSQGDYFVCGLYNGRVRAMFNDQGKKVKSAGPAMPVEVQGFEGVPEAGDEFAVVEDEKVARRIAEQRQLKEREKTLAKESKVTLETFLSQRAGEAVQTLNLVVKADVQGSLEAVNDAVSKLSTDEVKVNLIHGGTGAITETDILLASASSAIIIGFNVRPTAKVKDVAERENVDIRFYDIIYKLVNEIRDAMSGMLSPLTKEVYLGQAEVRETFSVPKVGTVAGCSVADGKILRNAGVRLLREGVVIYTGKISSLKRFKDDVKEVAKGYECGIGLENYNDIKAGDIIEAFEEVQEARTLD